jgi:glutaminyl-tRNA synthetase
MVGLKYAFRIVCDEVELDSVTGEPILLKCSILSETDRPDEKPKTSIQWVPASTAIPVETRLYSHLFTVEEPSDVTWEQELNPESEVVMNQALADPSLKIHAAAEKHVQFERLGFFVFDKDSDFQNNKFVVNLTVNLKDSKPKSVAGAGGAGSSSANRSRKDEQQKQLAEKLVSRLSRPFFLLSL